MRANDSNRLPSWLIGLVLVVVIAIASVLAFTKELPWGDAYEVRAVFGSAQSVRPSSPVRIAGVNVGKVTAVEPLTSAETEDLQAQSGRAAARDDGRRADRPAGGGGDDGAERGRAAAARGRDASSCARGCSWRATTSSTWSPGSPNAPVTDDGHTYPVNQTAYSVQLDQVLTTLQGDVRTDLQMFLDQLGNALIKYGGAEGFRELYRTSAPAGKYTSQVNQAVLGTEPGDLTGLIRGLDRVVRGLGRNEQTLQNLVTNFRVFSGSFAAEDVALGQAIEELPNTLEAAGPAFTNLNASFPALRAFAREALPGVRSTPETLRAATPFVAQIRALVSRARAARPGCRPAPDDPEAGAARAAHAALPRPDPGALVVLQRGRDPVGQRHGRADRPDEPVSARALRPGVRGDRLRTHRDRLREPLGRRQRPVRAGRGRRRHEHGQDPERGPEHRRRRAPGRGRA